jgi:hypothetical protein
MGFTYSHNAAAGSITGGTLVAPAATGAEVVLLSWRTRLATNTRATTTYTLTVPAGALNGGGFDTSMDDVNIPVQQVRQDGTTLSAVGNTIATSIAGNFASFQFGALPAAATGIVILANF